MDGYQKDANAKRAAYIDKQHEISQEFPQCHPILKTKTNAIYNCSFFSSPLWDLSGLKTAQLINTYSRSIHQLWDFPLQTHSNLIEPLSGTHLFVRLRAAHIAFIRRVSKSRKLPILNLLATCKLGMSIQTGKNMYTVRLSMTEDDFCEHHSRDYTNNSVRKYKKNNKFSILQPHLQ